MSLSFYSGAQPLSDSVVVIVGAGRSGKTLVGNILGSCQYVEHLDEPWLPLVLPVLAGEGVLPEPFTVQMFQTCVMELWYDRVLMRHASFRPTDLSSVWRQKTPQEIVFRLITMSSREDVRRYTREKHPTLVLTLTDTFPFWRFYEQAFPRCHIIHVIRDGLEVAQAIAEKHWFADEQLLRPQQANPFYAYTRDGQETRYLPYWVARGEEERFLGWSEFARGAYYWRRLIQLAPTDFNQAESRHTVKLADLLDRPQETIRQLLTTLEMTPTELTSQLLTGVSRSPAQAPSDVLDQLDRDQVGLLLDCYRRLSLPTQAIEAVQI